MSRLRVAFNRWAHQAPVSSRHEVVLALAGASLISGIGQLAQSGLRPNSVTILVPPVFAVVWYIVLAGGGTALIVSAALHDRLDALLWERPAFSALGCGALVYAICLIAPGHGTAFVASVGYLLYAAAALVRSLRITLYLRFLRSLPPVTVDA